MQESEEATSEPKIKNMGVPALTRRELNSYSRFITRSPVSVDLERNLVTAQVRIPTLQGETEISLTYALNILNETGLSVKPEFIVK